MSDKKLLDNETTSYLINKIKKHCIPFSDILELEEKTVEYTDFTNKELLPTGKDGFSKVIINPLSTNEITVKSNNAEQIVEDMISKVTVEPVILEEKEINLNTTTEVILPEAGKDGFSKVTITPRPPLPISQEKIVTISPDDQIITPDDGYETISKLTIPSSTLLYDCLITNDVFDVDEQNFGTLNSCLFENYNQKIKSINSENTTSWVRLNGMYESFSNLEFINIPNGSMQFSKLTNSQKLQYINAKSFAIHYTSSFENCINLSSLCPITQFNSTTLTLQEKTFKNCQKLTSLNFLIPVIYIGYQCFSDCTGFTTFSFPDVKQIIAEAFLNCTNLETITLGSSATRIDETAFSGCTALQTITVNGNSSCTTAQTLQALDPSKYNNATIVYTESAGE